MNTVTLVLLIWISVAVLICAVFSAVKTVDKSRERDMFLAIRQKAWRKGLGL
jgi:hypothetical protein